MQQCTASAYAYEACSSPSKQLQAPHPAHLLPQGRERSVKQKGPAAAELHLLLAIRLILAGCSPAKSLAQQKALRACWRVLPLPALPEPSSHAAVAARAADQAAAQQASAGKVEKPLACSPLLQASPGAACQSNMRHSRSERGWQARGCVLPLPRAPARVLPLPPTSAVRHPLCCRAAGRNGAAWQR